MFILKLSNACLAYKYLKWVGIDDISLFVLIIRFRQFGAGKCFINSFSNFKVLQNQLKREKINKKTSFFPITPRIRIHMKIFARIRIRKKNADPKPCFLAGVYIPISQQNVPTLF